jgi:hypothetical protein
MAVRTRLTASASVSETAFRRGDVVWAPDPFRSGPAPRPWLVLAAASIPYPGEEYVCAALTTSDLPQNHQIGDSWVEGRDPDRTSYCSPWVLATIKHDAITAPQGSVTDSFVDRMADRAQQYLTAG